MLSGYKRLVCLCTGWNNGHCTLNNLQRLPVSRCSTTSAGVTGYQSGDDSPSFKAIAPAHPPKLATVGIVPGKGPPPEPPVDCCMSGCANCVWIQYAEELTNYYRDGGETARKELEKIENPGLRAFIKLEIGLR